jgi:DNA-binding FrmR family transcriptional regulator
MTGKELVLAFVGAGLVGGGAGVAANVAMAPKAEAPAAPSAELLGRLEAIEGQLAQAKKASEESRRTLLEVQDRVTKAEIAASQPATDAASGTVASSGMKFRVARHGTKTEAGASAAEGVVDAAPELGEAIALNLGDELGKLDLNVDDFGGELASLQNGFKLRALPEADRWQKAKDELGLTWNQVEDLKKAFSDRDAAMKDAMTKETKAGPNGGTITIQRPDPAKLAHADAAYHDRVNATLDERQKKDWGSKGYDHAFGSAPFGGGNMVMTIGVGAEAKPADAPKDAAK